MLRQHGQLAGDQRQFAVALLGEGEGHLVLARLFRLGDVLVVGIVEGVGVAQRLQGGQPGQRNARRSRKIEAGGNVRQHIGRNGGEFGQPAHRVLGGAGKDPVARREAGDAIAHRLAAQLVGKGDDRRQIATLGAEQAGDAGRIKILAPRRPCQRGTDGGIAAGNGHGSGQDRRLNRQRVTPPGIPIILARQPPAIDLAQDAFAGQGRRDAAKAPRD